MPAAPPQLGKPKLSPDVAKWRLEAQSLPQLRITELMLVRRHPLHFLKHA